MNKCSTYCTLCLYANSAPNNTPNQVVGVLKIAKKNSTTGTTKKLDTLVSASGLRSTLKSYSNIIKNTPLRDEKRCESGGRNIGKTLFFRLKIKLVIKLAKLLKFQRVSSAKNVVPPQQLKDTTKTIADLLTLVSFVGNAASTSARADYPFSAAQHLILDRGKYKL